MSENILNTRIQLKGDSFKNWSAQNPVLKENELAVVKIEENDNHLLGAGIYFKVGDGVKNFSQLNFSGGIDGRVISEALDKDTLIATINNTIASAGIATDEAIQALSGRVTTIEELVGSKSVAAQIAEEIAKLETVYDTKGSAEQALADAKEYADSKVASVNATDNSILVSGTSTDPTIGVKISAEGGNDLILKEDGLFVDVPEAASYSIIKDEDAGEYAAIYHLTKDGVNTGTAINIPKDMVVQSGEVVTDPEGQSAGTYIKLVLQNVEEPLYINVGNLIEYVTSGSIESDMVVVAVSDEHKVTATITDGTITKTKLETSVQTSLNKADTALQKSDVVTGSTNGTISVGGSDVSVYGLGTAAYKAVGDFDPAGAAEEAINSLNKEDTAVEKQFVTSVSELEGIISIERRALVAEDIPVIEQSQVNGLEDSLNSKTNNSELATIAKSGNVKDLVQTDGDVLVLNCGTSTVNV